MKYACLCYSERSELQPPDPLDEEVDTYGEELRLSGRLLVSEEFTSSEASAVIRVRNGQMTIREGAAEATAAQLSSFHLIDARDLNDAIRIASQLPFARVGHVEIRPVRMDVRFPN